MRTIRPMVWGGAIFIASQALSLIIAMGQIVFLEEAQIAPPSVSLGPPLIYFASAVVVIGLVLFLVPAAILKLILKALFGLLYSFGAFIALGFFVPVWPAGGIAVAAGLLWWFRPRIWLHNVLLFLTMAGVGAVFGLILSPWTAMALMGIISVYDFLAVRFRYMVWMAERMSEMEALPAFLIPPGHGGWNAGLRGVALGKSDGPDEPHFSVLGGGDIGFPLLVNASVYYAYGLASFAVVASFSLAGLMAAFLIQMFLLKGKPMPALPPIATLSALGLAIVYFFM